MRLFTSWLLELVSGWLVLVDLSLLAEAARLLHLSCLHFRWGSIAEPVRFCNVLKGSVAAWLCGQV